MKIKQPILMICVALVLSGCASYKKKFRDKTVANVGYFADSTITMLGELDMQLNREDTLLVRRFIDNNGEEELQVAEMNAGLKRTLANIVRYSIEIVNIAESDCTETNRVAIYADYISQFREGMLEHNLIDSGNFDDTVQHVREQSDFLEALRKAQPLLNSAVLEISLEIDDLIVAINQLSKKIDARIDNEYGDIIRYRQKLEREKFDILMAFENIYDAYRNDDPDLSSLRESGIIWTPEIIPEGRPTREDLNKLGEHLKTRLLAFHAVHETLDPNWQDYLSTHRELDAVVDKTIDSAQRARVVMLTWVRAHQKMSSGTTDPAGWFDVGEVTKQLIKGAPGAVL